jgi:hypothetical protein
MCGDVMFLFRRALPDVSSLLPSPVPLPGPGPSQPDNCQCQSQSSKEALGVAVQAMHTTLDLRGGGTELEADFTGARVFL